MGGRDALQDDGANGEGAGGSPEFSIPMPLSE
jgi:hypothetical protein